MKRLLEEIQAVPPVSPDGRTVALSRRDEDLGVLKFIDVGEFSPE